MWNAIFWSFTGTICLVISFHALPGAMEKCRNKKPDMECARAIMLLFMGLTFSLILFPHSLCEIRKTENIMNPEDISQEIHKVLGQIPNIRPSNNTFVLLRNGQGNWIPVADSSSLDPEVSHVEKNQKIDGTWELRSTDYVDPIEDYEKRSAELKKANDQETNQ